MLRWADPFEQYGAIAHMIEGIGGGAAWSQVDDWGWSLSTANPATGTHHLRLSDSDTEDRIIRRILGVANDVAGFGYRFNVAELPELETDGALVMADFRDVANVTHTMIVMGTDGSVFATRGSLVGGVVGGTSLGRADPCIAPGGYHHFEVKEKIDNSTGYIEVRMNQVTVLNLTGKDTQNTANAAVAQFALGQRGNALSGTPAFGTFDLDDCFAWDDDASDLTNTVVDFIGDKGAYWLPVTADTAINDFDITGSVTAYGALDEVPPSGADYLHTALTSARVILGVAALPDNVSEVIAYIPVGYMQKDESGPVTMRMGLVSGTDETYGPNDDPATAYAYLRPGPKTIDPATGVPWSNDPPPDLLIERTA
jgi:hypothetical protein